MDARGQLTLNVHLDTHVLLWVSQGRIRALGARAYRLVIRQPWTISPAVVLELEILCEIGRVRAEPSRVLQTAGDKGDLTIATTPFTDVVKQAAMLSWTRDPFDRMITATAIADGAQLLTADKTILANFPDAVWD